MKYKTPTITKHSPDQEVLFQESNLKSILHIQDHDHNGTKFRNRILKAGIVLPMGDKMVNIAHLKMLINDFSKDKHGLVMGDVCPDDRQNVKSLSKIIEPRVITALKNHVIESEGTSMYLSICSEVIAAFKNVDLQPCERVYHIFHAAYFIRAWKMWLRQSGTRVFIISKEFF